MGIFRFVEILFDSQIKQRDLFEQQMMAIADCKVTLEDMFAVEDKVVSRGVYEYPDLATQERSKAAFMVINRFEGGKIKEEWQILVPFTPPSQ
jgi:ketosteroid isomerase-like protein